MSCPATRAHEKKGPGSEIWIRGFREEEKLKEELCSATAAPPASSAAASTAATATAANGTAAAPAHASAAISTAAATHAAAETAARRAAGAFKLRPTITAGGASRTLERPSTEASSFLYDRWSDSD